MGLSDCPDDREPWVMLTFRIRFNTLHSGQNQHQQSADENWASVHTITHPMTICWPTKANSVLHSDQFYNHHQHQGFFFLFSVSHSLIFYSLDSASIAPPSLDKNPGKRQVAREKTVCLRVERAMSLGCFGLLALKWSMAAEFSSASTPRRRRSKSSSTTTAPLRPLASFSPLHDSCSAYVRFGDRGH